MGLYQNRKTGEIIDVIAYSGTVDRDKADYIAFIDEEGNERKEWANIYWDYRPVDMDIDKDNRLRERVVMGCMQALVQKSNIKLLTDYNMEREMPIYISLMRSVGTLSEMMLAMMATIDTEPVEDMDEDDEDDDDEDDL